MKGHSTDMNCLLTAGLTASCKQQTFRTSQIFNDDRR